MVSNNIDFNNKNILITSGEGFIGRDLDFYFQENIPKSTLIVFDCYRNTENFCKWQPKCFGRYKNIDNQADFASMAYYKFDFVFHQVAISDNRIFYQEIVLKKNINSFYDLLVIAKKDRAVMVYASSAA